MKETTIDMAKYADSEEIHEKCAGCEKAFDWHGDQGTMVVQKCLTYIRPAMWWEDKPIAIKEELVVSKTHPKGIWVSVPAVIRMCPVATHVALEETPEGVQVNPLKAAKRAQRGG